MLPTATAPAKISLSTSKKHKLQKDTCSCSLTTRLLQAQSGATPSVFWSVQQCAATCFSTSKKHKLQKYIWRQDYCWPNQVTWSKQHQENNQTNQSVTIQGTLWYSQIIESSFLYWTIGRPIFFYPPQLTEIHIYACSRNTNTDGLNKRLVEC